MRYPAEHNEETQDRILAAASRLFRENGIAAVGLASIMKAAGLTVGTFYTHFASKEALLKEALRRALVARAEELEETLRTGNLEAALRVYLSPEHRDDPGLGCPTAALAPELSRHARATRLTYATALAPSLESWAKALSKRRGKKVGPAEAAAFVGLLAGTLQLARAVPDRAESAAILEAGVDAALRLACG
jgi:AcrR family transcriptional regulator